MEQQRWNGMTLSQSCSNKGELGSRIRELLTRLSPIMGFTIKVVENTGTSLRNKLSQSYLWEGAPCGRDDCVTCHQDEEVQVQCSRRNLVYVTLEQGGKGR